LTGVAKKHSGGRKYSDHRLHLHNSYYSLDGTFFYEMTWNLADSWAVISCAKISGQTSSAPTVKATSGLALAFMRGFLMLTGTIFTESSEEREELNHGSHG